MAKAGRPFLLSVLCFSTGYLSYAVSKGVFLLLTLPLWLVALVFPQTGKRILGGMVHRYLGFFTRRWLPFVGLYRVVEVSGLQKAQANSPCILVANHRGYMDSLFILGLVPRTGVLMKATNARRATYAMLERQFDLVTVDRNSLNSVGDSLARCKKVLNHSSNLLIFPEGTRAPSGRLQNFNRIAFQLAHAAGKPIIPVVIHSTHPFMAKLPGSIFPRGRIEYRIRFLDPLFPTAAEPAHALSDRVYQVMAKELRILDTGTVWAPNQPVAGAEVGTPSGPQVVPAA
jgi:1-acyl-sn-glycerol-3-phosphate acyltransferase